MTRVLCWFGWHTWERRSLANYDQPGETYVRCRRCWRWYP